jgi:hypothetical protein
MSTKPLVVNVHVDEIILKHFQSRLRKTRLLISTKTSNYQQSELRNLIEKRLPYLQNQPYRLLCNFQPNQKYIGITDDIILNQVFTTAQKEQFSSIQMLVKRSPGLFPLPPLTSSHPSSSSSSLLQVDPDDAMHYIMISFYRFIQIENIQQITEELKELWSPLKALGRVYVANEGINGQMAIPENVLELFIQWTQAYPYLKDVIINTDHTMTRQEYETIEPFRNLYIRPRKQIVTDGLLSTSTNTMIMIRRKHFPISFIHSGYILFRKIRGTNR